MAKSAAHRTLSGPMPRFSSPVHFFGYHVYKFFYLAAVLGVIARPSRAQEQLTQNINLFTSGSELCVKEYDLTADYFPNKVIPDDSDLWSVEYFGAYKIALNKALNHTYVLYQCGTPRPTPDLSTYEDLANAFIQFMDVPRRTLAVDETVPLTMLEILGYTRDIQFINNATTQYVVSPCIQRMIEQNASIALSDDPEKQAQQLASVDLHIASPFNATPKQNQLIFSATEDFGPLHRVEWVEFLGVFFNLESEAAAYTSGVRQRYQDLAEQATPANPKTVIAYITTYDGTYTIDDTDYKVAYMTDAGGDPLGGGVFTDLKKFHQALSNAQVVIDEAYWPSDLGAKSFDDFLEIYGFNDTSSMDFPFIKNKEVYGIDGRVNPRGWLDWYEGAVARADLVLEDFVSITENRHLLPQPYKRTWLRRLVNETQTVVTSADCLSTSEAASTPASGVTPTSASTAMCTGTDCEGATAAENACGGALPDAILASAVAMIVATLS